MASVLKAGKLLTCGHRTTTQPALKVPGIDRRKDLYMCPDGCGLQKRK